MRRAGVSRIVSTPRHSESFLAWRGRSVFFIKFPGGVFIARPFYLPPHRKSVKIAVVRGCPLSSNEE
jgi:hypothetical protein